MVAGVFSAVFPPPKFAQWARDGKDHKGSVGMGSNISTTNEADGGTLLL